MAGRRRRRSPRRLASKYRLAVMDLSIGGLASGGDATVAIVDNSSVHSNQVVSYFKIVVRGQIKVTVDSLLMFAVVRDTEGAAAHTLDNGSVVRDLRNENKMLRGPWALPVPDKDVVGATPLKAIVLKKIVLDENDDLYISVTNVGSSSLGGSDKVRLAITGYYREIA